jgi:hypothetical protein
VLLKTDVLWDARWRVRWIAVLHLQGQADQEEPLCLNMKMKVWKGNNIRMGLGDMGEIKIEGAC